MYNLFFLQITILCERSFFYKFSNYIQRKENLAFSDLKKEIKFVFWKYGNLLNDNNIETNINKCDYNL